MSTSSRRVLLVLGLCFALRLSFLLASEPWTTQNETDIVLQSDSRGYDRLARMLLTEHRFAYSSEGGPATLRTPLYPLFIAAIYALDGRPWHVLVVQVLLDTLTCALLFVVFNRLFAARTALVACGLYAIDPILTLYTSTLMSETLFLLTLVLSYYWLSRMLPARASSSVTTQTSEAAISRDRGMWTNAALAGAAVGAATLVRPVAQFLPIVVLLFLIAHFRRRPRVGAKTASAFLLAFVLVVAPWSMRNLRLFGSAWLSTSGAYNFLVLNVGTVEGTRLGVDPVSLQEPLLAEADSLAVRDGLVPETLNPFARARYRRDLALKYVRADPVGFARSYARGVANSLMNIASWEVARVQGWELPLVQMKTGAGFVEMARAYVRSKGMRGLMIAAAAVPVLLLSYVGVALGLVTAWRHHGRSALALSLLVALYFLAVTGAAGLARFKIPSIPFYLPFAAAGLLYLYDHGLATLRHRLTRAA